MFFAGLPIANSNALFVQGLLGNNWPERLVVLALLFYGDWIS